MTETTRPVFQGQIEAPNPIELFWEKNRRGIIAIAVAVAAAFVGNYGLQYYSQKQTDTRWSGVAAAAKLDRGYTEEGTMGFFLQSNGQWEPQPGMYLQATHQELVTKLREHIGSADGEALQRAIKEQAGTDAEPLLIWVAATRAAEKTEWAEARTFLADLERRFSSHFLCAKTAHPPQWQKEVEPEKNGEEDKPTKKNKKREKPKLEPAVEGSPVSLLRERIAAEEAFRLKNVWLYEAPEPDASPTAVIKLSNDEEIKIRFYSKQAPKHVESFLAKAGEPFFDGLRIDEVHRAGSGPTASAGSVLQLHFGLRSSKNDDRTKWDAERKDDSGSSLDFEHNDLSHFPGMVAAATEPKDRKKSSGERIWINATEAAARFDGNRVIFARVVEGLDVIERICKLSFADDEMDTAGQGQLQQNITIESIKIVE